MQPEAEPKTDWARHALRINGLIDNQVGALRKRQVVGSFEAKGGVLERAEPRGRLPPSGCAGLPAPQDNGASEPPYAAEAPGPGDAQKSSPTFRGLRQSHRWAGAACVPVRLHRHPMRATNQLGGPHHQQSRPEHVS